ncbi:MAG: hypothetical protein H7A23_23895 [Leptospiraceae bacterium]|nr:hypothetical protein [Leptospiraceae bacterium]MCP5497608.1 hypothetical protein [Leptospiraceae bacterium]
MKKLLLVLILIVSCSIGISAQEIKKSEEKIKIKKPTSPKIQVPQNPKSNNAKPKKSKTKKIKQKLKKKQEPKIEEPIIFEETRTVEPLGDAKKKPENEDEFVEEYEADEPKIGYKRGRTFIEFKAGGGYGGTGVFPYLFNLMFEFGKSNNWAFGFGMNTIRYSYKDFLPPLYQKGNVLYKSFMFDFVTSYHFLRNNKWDPLLRGYVGLGAVPGTTGLESGLFLHLGFGGGLRYHLSSKYYLTSELILDRYLGSPGKAGNEFFLNLQLGAGAAF